MNKFLTTIVFMSVLLFAPAAMASDECEVQDACVAMFGDHTSTKPAVDDMVCIWFSQRHPSEVKLVLYASPPTGDGAEGEGILFTADNDKGTRGKYCFGAWRLDETAWIMVCNDSRADGMNHIAIAELRQKGEFDLCVIGEGCL